MQINTDLQKLKPTFENPNGGYEWWYFDGLSKDQEYGFVIILYLNNPFSTNYIRELSNSDIKSNKHPAISISIYNQQKTIFYSFLEFEEDEFSWDQNELSLMIENHKLSYVISENQLEFKLELNQRLASGLALHGQLSGKSAAPSNNLISKGSGEEHLWNLILPSVLIQADLTVSKGAKEVRIRKEFQGYHDHNYGSEPMKNSFRDWYWGRFHFENYTLIYYLMNKHNNRQFEAWLIDKNNNQVLSRFDEIKLDYFQYNVFGLKSARKIEMKNEEAEVTIQLRTVADNGPFYLRFNGESVIKYQGKVEAAQGITEYIYPKNIYKKRFWPLVHMRLRYMNEEPHWVQKSQALYSRTW